MRGRSRVRVVVIASIALCGASPALARAPELPRDLRRQIAIDVVRCKPVGRADALLEAEVVLRAKARAVSLPGLHCAAYDEDGAAFYLTPVTGRVSLDARETQRLTVRFAADESHRECGCTVREFPRSASDDNPDTKLDDAKQGEILEAPHDLDESGLDAAVTSDPPAAPIDVAAEGGSSTTLAAAYAAVIPFAPPALRYERVLAPDLSLRAAPSSKAAVTGFAPPGARIAVDRIERGWKLARTSDGAGGWLPGDAATADIAAPERMAERLAPLHRALSLDASRSEALCATIERGSLGELVAAWRVHERAVYVHPLWYALTREDCDAFRAWAADCYSATRVIDAATGREIVPEKREARR